MTALLRYLYQLRHVTTTVHRRLGAQSNLSLWAFSTSRIIIWSCHSPSTRTILSLRMHHMPLPTHPHPVLRARPSGGHPEAIRSFPGQTHCSTATTSPSTISCLWQTPTHRSMWGVQAAEICHPRLRFFYRRRRVFLRSLLLLLPVAMQSCCHCWSRYVPGVHVTGLRRARTWYDGRSRRPSLGYRNRIVGYQPRGVCRERSEIVSAHCRCL